MFDWVHTLTWNAPAHAPDGFPVLAGRVVLVLDQHEEQRQRGDRGPEEGRDAGEDGQRAVGVTVPLGVVQHGRAPETHHSLID